MHSPTAQNYILIHSYVEFEMF